MFLSAPLRGEGSSFSLDDLYGSLGIFGHQNLDLESGSRLPFSLNAGSGSGINESGSETLDRITLQQAKTSLMARQMLPDEIRLTTSVTLLQRYEQR
jgi:hypothetical protein